MYSYYVQEAGGEQWGTPTLVALPACSGLHMSTEDSTLAPQTALMNIPPPLPSPPNTPTLRSTA